VLLAAGQPAAALRTLRTATSQLPLDPVAFERLATAAERVGDLHEAREALVRYAALVSGDRQQAHIASRIAGLSRRLGEPAVAADWLVRAVRLSPRSEDLVVRLADAQAAAGAREDARRTVSRALSEGFDSPTLRQLQTDLQFE
jgi:predicted Zn-dependent protease